MTKPTGKPRGRPRAPAIEKVCADTYEGTREIVLALVKESTNVPAWRPVRAAALMALGIGENSVWMTTEEFAAWIEKNFPMRQRGATGRMMDAVGFGKARRASLLAGERVRKVEALAMAHYGAGLPLPCPVGDVDAFSTWATEKFGAVRVVNAALELSESYVTDRMRGYDINGGRVPREPDALLIRALDWVWRMGAFSPYGQRPGAHPFPQQTEN